MAFGAWWRSWWRLISRLASNNPPLVGMVAVRCRRVWAGAERRGLNPFFGLPSLVQGFMSESLDQFATDIVLPAFTPTLGLFLAISTLYGLWKASQGVRGPAVEVPMPLRGWERGAEQRSAACVEEAAAGSCCNVCLGG